MRQVRFRTAAVALLVAATLATAAELPRGVMTELKQHYEGVAGGAAFRCINGKGGEIPASFVNDDYCDCEDGSDEPGTAACTYLADRYPTQFRFECLNEGFGKQTFFHSRVNDGVCDCCDGSDEYLPTERGGVTCPNTCAEAHAKAEKEKEERERVRQAGLAAKQQLISEAAASRSSLAAKKAEHEATLKTIDVEIAAAAAEKDKWEEEEKKERDEIHQKSLKQKEEWDAEQQKKKEAEEAEKAKTEEAAKEVDAAAGRISEEQGATPPNVICTKWRQTGECKGNGPRIPDSDKECDQIIDSGASGFCECVDMRTGLDTEYPFDCGHKSLTCQKMCEAEGKEAGFLDDAAVAAAAGNAAAAKAAEFHVDTGASHYKTEANEARSKHSQLTSKKAEAERGLKDVEDQLSGDGFGPEQVFLPLKGKCFERNEGHYTYTICPFDKVKQGFTNMGNWKAWGEQTYGAWGGKHDFSVMKYEDGDRCWNGPARSTEVRVVCGPTNEILSVDEPSMCTYKMVFQTPAICE